MSEWKTYNLGTFGGFTNGINKDKSAFGSGIPFVNLLDIYGKSFINKAPKGLVKVTESEIKNYDIRKGDVLFARSSVKPEGVGQSSAVLKTFDRIVYSGFIIRFRQFENKIWYLYSKYCFDNDAVRRSILAKSTVSANTNINQDSLKTIQIKLPPLPHQRKIARILTTVDNIIEKTEAAIAKYKAIKQGMMHDLFTRGIDVNTGKLRPVIDDAPALYKESELGMMPKDWNVARLGELINEKGEYGINAASCDYSPNFYTYLRITDISDDGSFLQEEKKSVSHLDAEKYLLDNGDIVFARTGNSTGKTYLYNPSDGKLVFAGFLIRFKPLDNKLSPIFLKFYTETEWYWNFVSLYSQRTGQPGINGKEYGDFKMRIPQRDEQGTIEKKLLSVNSTIHDEKQSLSKYQKLKKGLMQDLLTGKKEVTPDEEDFDIE